SLRQLPMHCARQDVDRAHRIAVRHKPTRWMRAAIHAPTGFVLMSTAGTGLRRVMLVYEFNADPLGLRLGGAVLPDGAMRPQRNLLLALVRQALAICSVAHVPYGDRACLARLCPVHHSARDRVLTIAGALVLLRKNALRAGLQPFPAARARRRAGLL